MNIQLYSHSIATNYSNFLGTVWPAVWFWSPMTHIAIHHWWPNICIWRPRCQRPSGVWTPRPIMMGPWMCIPLVVHKCQKQDKPRLYIIVYIYNYIYMCVCVCIHVSHTIYVETCLGILSLQLAGHCPDNCYATYLPQLPFQPEISQTQKIEGSRVVVRGFIQIPILWLVRSHSKSGAKKRIVRI